MHSNIFIPKIIKVGYQKRSGTYTGKLAYVIYVDEKNKVRKKKSWASWRDESINPNDFDNEPTSGFVLNKKAGGYASHWNTRQTYCRVYDPRGFEIEITIPNLLYILENCNAIKGKGLEGEFTYGWSGTELLLLPVDAPDYKKYTAFSDGLFGKKIGAKDLIEGSTHKFANGEVYVYLGRFPEYDNSYRDDLKGTIKSKSSFFFFDIGRDNDKRSNYNGEFYGIKVYKSLPKIAQCLDEGSYHNYASLMDILGKDVRHTPPVIYELKTTPYTFEEFKQTVIDAVSKKRYSTRITVKSMTKNNIVTEKEIYIEKEDLYMGYNSHGKSRTLQEIFDLLKPVKIEKIKQKTKGELQNV